MYCCLYSWAVFFLALPSPGKSPTAVSPNHPTNLLGTFLTFSSLILQYAKGLCLYTVCVCACVFMSVCVSMFLCVHIRVGSCLCVSLSICLWMELLFSPCRGEIRDTLQALPHYSDVCCGGPVCQCFPSWSQHQFSCNPAESSMSLKSLRLLLFHSLHPTQPMLHRKFRKERQPKSAPLACSMLGKDLKLHQQ